jgi:hypothetical protein
MDHVRLDFAQRCTLREAPRRGEGYGRALLRLRKPLSEHGLLEGQP